jgi:hypothetical protein
LVKLPFIKKKKKLMVRLTARGGRNLPIGVFEVRDMKELMSKITEALQNNEEAKKYPNIRILNLEDGTEVKISNPFAVVEESEESQSSGRRGSSLAEEITLPVVMENIKGVLLTVSKFNAEVFKGLLESYGKALSDIAVTRNPAELIKAKPELSLKDIVELVKALPELAKYKDEIAKLIREGLSLTQESGKSG